MRAVRSCTYDGQTSRSNSEDVRVYREYEHKIANPADRDGGNDQTEIVKGIAEPSETRRETSNGYEREETGGSPTRPTHSPRRRSLNKAPSAPNSIRRRPAREFKRGLHQKREWK